MSMPLIETDTEHGAVIYPESDGKPMAENPTQGRVIRTLVCGFERLFDGRADVFVVGDFFWYPVQGDSKTVAAPDVTVIADLPKPINSRAMGSYQQWVFGGRVMLAAEVLSPSNTWTEMARKHEFYEQFGVEEYWVFDPMDGELRVYLRDGERLREVADSTTGWTSTTTGVSLAVEGFELLVRDVNGRLWLAPADEAIARDEAWSRIEEMERNSRRAARQAFEAEAEAQYLRDEIVELRRQLAK
jgi:Uma2 family endonuclease